VSTMPLQAVKAALSEGIVPGGGVTLVNLAAAVSIDDKDDQSVPARDSS